MGSSMALNIFAIGFGLRFTGSRQASDSTTLGAAYVEDGDLIPLAGEFAGVPVPSLIWRMPSTETFSNFSRSPLGQRTSTQSILAAAPNPKCTRISLLESKLEPLRTSS